MTAAIPVQIPLPLEAIREFCIRWNVVEFALFGSVLRDDFRDDSDIDVLLTFQTGKRIRLTEWISLSDELEAMFGRKVDAMTRKSIEASPNYLRRRHILDSAQVIYAE